MEASRTSWWRVALRTTLVLGLCASIAAGVHVLVPAWWGVVVGLASPWLVVLVGVAIVHAWDRYLTGDYRVLGTLRLRLDGSNSVVKYEWSGDPRLVGAAALVYFEELISYYARSAIQTQLISRARDLATARLQERTVATTWQAVAGKGEIDVCELGTARIGITYSRPIAVFGTQLSPAADLEAALALLCVAFSELRGPDLARGVLAIANSDDAYLRRWRRVRRVLAPIVEELS